MLDNCATLLRKYHFRCTSIMEVGHFSSLCLLFAVLHAVDSYWYRNPGGAYDGYGVGPIRRSSSSSPLNMDSLLSAMKSAFGMSIGNWAASLGSTQRGISAFASVNGGKPVAGLLTKSGKPLIAGNFLNMPTKKVPVYEAAVPDDDDDDDDEFGDDYRRRGFGDLVTWKNTQPYYRPNIRYSGLYQLG